MLLCVIFAVIFVSDLSVSQQTKEAFSDIVQSEKDVNLSAESTQLLEEIQKEVVAYNAKLKSGKIEFSITQSQQVNGLQRKGKVEYKDVGTWHVIHNFEGARHFYDVKIHKKMEFNGTPLPNWTEKRYQFQIVGKKMLIRKQKETGWIQYPQPADKSVFESEFNPRNWGWNPGVFSIPFLVRFYTPIKVERVEVNNIQLYLITLHRADSKTSSRILQLWIDPQKGYRPTRSLLTRKWLSQGSLVAPDGTRKLLPTEESVSHIHYMYQIEQFKPGIWFPKTAICKPIYELVTQRSYRKIQMQVNKVVFNIPIAEKDLRFSD